MIITRIAYIFTRARIGPNGAPSELKAAIIHTVPLRLKKLPNDPRMKLLRSNGTAPVEKLTTPTIWKAKLMSPSEEQFQSNASSLRFLSAYLIKTEKTAQTSGKTSEVSTAT